MKTVWLRIFPFMSTLHLVDEGCIRWGWESFPSCLHFTWWMKDAEGEDENLSLHVYTTPCGWRMKTVWMGIPFMSILHLVE
jgi:hypothetical protein